jgi:DNA polymerase III delta subunit
MLVSLKLLMTKILLSQLVKSFEGFDRSGDVLGEWKKKKLSNPCILLTNDSLRIERFFSWFHSKILPDQTPRENIEGSTLSTAKDIQRVAEECLTLSLFSSLQCKVIRNVEQVKATPAKELLNQMKNFSHAQSFLFFTLKEDAKLAASLDSIREQCTIIEFDQVAGARRAQWIEK